MEKRKHTVEVIKTDLEINEELDLHEKGWKFQRIGWIFIFLLVALSAFGFFGDGLVFRPIQQLFDFIDGNGPAPDIEPRFASIEILHTIAVVHLEVKRWSGQVIGPEPRTMSDLFNLIKTDSGWKISQKMFHVHLG